ncbi:hypothetical protein FQN51_001897 [Onygenales sp. PD_10]|nr:hypothetical protein FQN51_001897 [Onygenales sp. PD_10]
MLRSILIQFSAAIFALAACTGKEKVTLSDFTLHPVENPHLKGLAEHLKDQKTSLTAVINSGNHQLTKVKDLGYHPVKQAKAWEAKPDYNDFETKKWVPQGLSGSADAYDKGTWNEKDAWVVSWHNHNNSNVRVTFVDKATFKYRHVLLVYPEADDNFKKVPVHAGGIVWYGETLWVVDTDIGFRVFDLTNIWEVDIGDDVGKSPDGKKYTADGYRYVIPQSRYYKLSPQHDFKFSWTSLDRTDSPDTIMAGEWREERGIARVLKWELDAETRTLKTNADNVATASFGYCVGAVKLHGGVSVDGKVYMAGFSNSAPGDMYEWTPGKTPAVSKEFFPPAPEDMSYNKQGDELYTLTEIAGKRYILTYDRSKV